MLIALQEDLEKVVSKHAEFPPSMQAAFYTWYNKVITSGPVSPMKGAEIPTSQPNQIPASVCRTRLRISFDSDEVNKLQKWFDQDPHPSKVLMTSYLNELNSLPARASQKPLDLTNIMYWFKNARAAARRNGRSITSDDLSDDDDRQSDREEMTASAPPLPNSNAVYMIKDPLHTNKDINANRDNTDDESDMEEDLSVTDDEADDDHTNDRLDMDSSEKDSTDMRAKKDMSEASGNNQSKTKAEVSTTSQNLNANFISSMASRLPGYPFPYGALPMAYIQSQMNPFYKDWTEKVQSVVAQAQANSAQQNINMVKSSMVKSECELSKSERQKRHRAFIDPVSEIPKLEQWFNKDTHPSHYVIEQICDDLNRGEFRSRYPKLSPKNIQLWFKNHRAKVKRMRVGGNLSLSFSNVGSPSMSPPPSGLSLSVTD